MHESLPDETTPLLIRPSPPDSGIPPSFLANGKAVLNGSATWSERLHDLAPKSVAKFVKGGVVDSPKHLQTALRSIPAVILGSLLNILDGVSCRKKASSGVTTEADALFLQTV